MVWVLTTPETAGQYERDARTIEANGHDSDHSNFNATRKVPKTASPMKISQRGHTNSSAYTVATPRDFGVGRSPRLSPGHSMLSLKNPASRPNRELYPLPKPLHSSSPSGAKKRRIPSKPSPLPQGSKRQRILPSEPEILLQTKTAVIPSRQSAMQGPQISPASVEGSTLSLSEDGPIFDEKISDDHVGARQSKAAGLRISTKSSESTAPPTPGEKLYADYVNTHDDFRRELDNLARELAAANKRADTAELRIQKAENKVYQANNVGFAKLKIQEDLFRKESEKQHRVCKSLRIRCDALELSIEAKNKAIEKLKRQLVEER